MTLTTTRKNLNIIMLTERSQTEKDETPAQFYLYEVLENAQDSTVMESRPVGVGKQGEVTKGQKETSGMVATLGGFLGVHMSRLTKLHKYVQFSAFTSIKVLERNTETKMYPRVKDLAVGRDTSVSRHWGLLAKFFTAF